MFGQTPTTLYDNLGNLVYPSKAFVDGGQGVNTQRHDVTRIHSGVMYTVSIAQASLGASGLMEIAFKANGTNDLHYYFKVAAEGKGWINIRRNATSIVGGTVQTPRNRNGSYSDSSTALVTLNPSTVTGGTSIFDLFVPGGFGGMASGAVGSMCSEWVVPAGTMDVLAFSNTAGVARDVSFEISFYEVAP